MSSAGTLYMLRRGEFHGNALYFPMLCVLLGVLRVLRWEFHWSVIFEELEGLGAVC